MTDYIYELTLWRDTTNVIGVDPVQEAIDVADFDTNYKPIAKKITVFEEKGLSSIHKTYTEFKSMFSSTLYSIDYIETENAYYVSFYLNSLFPPKSSDGQEFIRPSPMTVGKTLKVKGFGIECPPNETTSYDIKFTSDIELTGGTSNISQMDFNDTVSFQAVDKDNVLGYGANTILNHFVIDGRGIGSDHVFKAVAPGAYLFPSYFYLRLIYTNSSATTTKYVTFNLEYYA